MDIIKKFLLRDDRITKDSYIWNMISNFLSAFQSVIILIVLTRVLSLEESGIFTIATANAILFLYIGKYGVRNYQVSDIKNGSNFCDYLIARYITVTTMCIASILYVLRFILDGEYTYHKAMIIMLMCIYKIPDAFEDVYYGEYQKKVDWILPQNV